MTSSDKKLEVETSAVTKVVTLVTLTDGRGGGGVEGVTRVERNTESSADCASLSR